MENLIDVTNRPFEHWLGVADCCTEPLERLRVTRAFLRDLKDPSASLDMTVFHVERECGTAACAAGWSAALFPKLMRIVGRESFEGDTENTVIIVNDDGYLGSRGTFAAGELWGVDYEFADFICDPSSYGEYGEPALAEDCGRCRDDEPASVKHVIHHITMVLDIVEGPQ